MPSIRVRSAHYPHIRDLFHIPHDSDDNSEPLNNPNESAPSPTTTTGVPSPQAQPLFMRPISMPNLRDSNQNDDTMTSPISLTVIEPSFPDRRPRSSTMSSRIRTHVLDRSRESRAYRESDSRGLGSSSTEALTHRSESPTLFRVAGGQADVFLNSDNNNSSHHGILEEALNEGGSSAASRMRTIYDRNHHDDIVEHLDVIDRQIGTVSNLTNAANSIVIPPSSFYSRKPVIILSSRRPPKNKEKREYEDPLDQHVNEVLESPSRIRRTLLGVWSFLKTPMGILTGIYGFLVVFWGAAIVFFLAKFINLHDADLQGFWVEVSSQIVCGLFTVTSVGFIPSRILSTFRVYKIWHYKRETIKRRKEAGLPQLFDPDDLPDPIYDPNFVHVLTDEEHKDLHRQQTKFAYQETWYRAHGTETHRAFPINAALWICFLNDANSIFQVILCGTMWGMNRFQRPAWSTGILIPAGFLCGIGSAVLIWRGGERTKRVEEVRERLRAVLAQRGSSQPVAHLLESPPSPQDRNQRMTTVKFADQVPTNRLSEEALNIHVDEEMTIPRTVA